LGIITNFPVGLIFDSRQSYFGRAYADCRHAAADHHVPVQIVRRSVRWSTDDGVSIDILAPTNAPLSDTGDDMNENSIVARLSYAGNNATFSVQLMGDAGLAREAELLRSGIELRADLRISLKSVTTGHDTHRRRRLLQPFIPRLLLSPSVVTISLGTRRPTRSRRCSATVLRSTGPTVAEPSSTRSSFGRPTNLDHAPLRAVKRRELCLVTRKRSPRD